MKLYDLLRVITHQDYKVMYKDINFFDVVREIDKKDIKDYLEYSVESLDENFIITILAKKI